jgi:transcriptional regulator with GAF, ATPase, and Fis domain
MPLYSARFMPADIGTLPLEETGGRAPQRFLLRVTAGPDAGLVHAGSGDRTVIGTHESADLRLTDPTVSRFHCEIVSTARGLLVTDLESRNGTRIDRLSVLQARASQGASLVLGRTTVALEIEAHPAEILRSQRDRFGVMVGQSPALRRAFALLERAAASDATVLLEGETGTGKDAAAESIHRESGRRDQPLIVVDCGALPASLLEAELFGYERGAFTGAVEARAGAFESATGGTVFLDEIGELALELQPKLLRVLERREVKRLGAARHKPVDVRVIAATNRRLHAEVNDQRFRSDLYYRLAVIEIRLPPLRERAEDLPLLVEHLLRGMGSGAEAEAARLREPAFLAELARHSWPGNVRELRNFLERCVALGELLQPAGAATAAAAPEAPAGGDPSLDSPRLAGSPDRLGIDLTLPLKEARQRHQRRFEEQYVRALMDHHGGNIAAAARSAGVDRITLYRLLWRFGMR